MEARAKVKNVRMAPRKMRLVVDLIRGKRVEDAIGVLDFNPRAASKVVAKALKAAVANAEATQNVDVDALYVKTAFVDAANVQKRFMPRAHGRATQILKRGSHVTIVVDEKKKKG